MLTCKPKSWLPLLLLCNTAQGACRGPTAPVYLLCLTAKTVMKTERMVCIWKRLAVNGSGWWMKGRIKKRLQDWDGEDRADSNFTIRGWDSGKQEAIKNPIQPYLLRFFEVLTYWLANQTADCLWSRKPKWSYFPLFFYHCHGPTGIVFLGIT